MCCGRRRSLFVNVAIVLFVCVCVCPGCTGGFEYRRFLWKQNLKEYAQSVVSMSLSKKWSRNVWRTAYDAHFVSTCVWHSHPHTHTYSMLMAFISRPACQKSIDTRSGPTPKLRQHNLRMFTCRKLTFGKDFMCLSNSPCGFCVNTNFTEAACTCHTHAHT